MIESDESDILVLEVWCYAAFAPQEMQSGPEKDGSATEEVFCWTKTVPSFGQAQPASWMCPLAWFGGGCQAQDYYGAGV